MSLPVRKTVVIAVVVVVAAASPFVYGLLFWGDYPTEQTATRTFTLDEDFTTVRKILVRKDGAQKIITMGGDSEFVDQHWKQINAEPGKEDIGEALLDLVASPNPSWQLQLEGTLKVRTLDEYVGQHVVTLQQVVVIEPDFLDSKVDLVKGTERLIGYAMHTRFAREQTKDKPDESSGPLRQLIGGAQGGGQTKIELSLTQKIITQAPWFAHRVADRRVRESVEKTLANQERAIRQFIEENKSDVPVFPLR